MAAAPQQRTIPPEGLPMPPTETEATASPTTKVLQYLQSRGYQPTTENVRRALEANAKDPGLIPGLRSDTAATEAEDQAAMRAAGQRRGGGGGGGGGGRSTLPADLTHGPTNEADWQPGTTSAQPAAAAAAADVQRMQQATLPAMRAGVPNVPVQPSPPDEWDYRGTGGQSSDPAAQFRGRQMTINPDALPGPRNPALASQQPTSLEQMMIEALSGPQPQGMLPPPPRQITGPPSAPEAPMASPNTPIPMPGEQAPPRASPGLQVENVPMPPPQQIIQAPPASSIPSSGGLSIEDRMMPGRGNLTIQAPSAGNMPPTQAPVIQETRPILDKIIRGGVGGAGAGRMLGVPGAVVGGVAGAAPGLWDLGRHIVGR